MNYGENVKYTNYNICCIFNSGINCPTNRRTFVATMELTDAIYFWTTVYYLLAGSRNKPTNYNSI